MNTRTILGAALLVGSGYAAASCDSGGGNSTTSTGGQAPSSGGQSSNSGGQSSNSGGAPSNTGGGTSAGGEGASSGGGSTTCSSAAGTPAKFDDDGGLTKIGATDPAKSVVLQDGGYYAMPNTKYQGYCFTYADTGGSTVYPPCGTTGPCFTLPSGLCLSANMPPGSATAWGGGFGCSLNQATVAGAVALIADVIGMNSITIGVYGCSMPDQLQIQLNVVNPPIDVDSGAPGTGYFCNRAILGPADANGVRSVTVPLTDLRQDCWLTGGPVFDPATMSVRSIQAQVNATENLASNWDFCVSQLSIQ
jgi:hypothetical protein